MTSVKRVYNYRVCRCRRVVENAFGILAQRWRVYFRPLTCNIDTVNKIIKATTVLHNYLRCRDDTVPITSAEAISESYKKCWKSVPRLGSQASKEANDIRDKFMAYFNSDEGRVPWQVQHM